MTTAVRRGGRAKIGDPIVSRFPPDLVEDLNELAEEAGVSRSEVIRVIVTRTVIANKRRRAERDRAAYVDPRQMTIE